MDWFTWRVAMSSRIPDGLYDVRYRWRFKDLIEAHHFLDALEAIQDLKDRG